MDAFYEWKAGTPKQPYAFVRADREPVVFAQVRGAVARARRHRIAVGHHHHHRGRPGHAHARPTTGSCSIGPTGTCGSTPGITDRTLLEALLRPSGEARALIHYPVDRAVGNVRNDRPELVDEVALVTRASLTRTGTSPSGGEIGAGQSAPRNGAPKLKMPPSEATIQ